LVGLEGAGAIFRCGMPKKKKWKVVGGEDKGGIMVREGKDMKSTRCEEKLSMCRLKSSRS